MSHITHEVKLWLDNEEGSYRAVVEMTEAALEQALENEDDPVDARNAAEENLATALENWLAESMPELDGLWGSLLHSVFQEIEFGELAETYLGDYDIYSIYSSEAGECTLFRELDSAREWLADEKLDSDNTLHAGLFLALARLEVGGEVVIEGETYRLEKH